MSSFALALAYSDPTVFYARFTSICNENRASPTSFCRRHRWCSCAICTSSALAYWLTIWSRCPPTSRVDAINELTEVHAVALRLHDSGHDTTHIATALGMEIESVRILLRVAEAKLARLIRSVDPMGRAVQQRPIRTSS
jgi:hypothetical protein